MCVCVCLHPRHPCTESYHPRGDGCQYQHPTVVYACVCVRVCVLVCVHTHDILAYNRLEQHTHTTHTIRGLMTVKGANCQVQRPAVVYVCEIVCVIVCVFVCVWVSTPLATLHELVKGSTPYGCAIIQGVVPVNVSTLLPFYSALARAQAQEKCAEHKKSAWHTRKSAWRTQVKARERECCLWSSSWYTHTYIHIS